MELDIPTTFAQANQFLLERGPGRMEPSLAHIQELVELLGNPHEGFQSIQVTGTNGKTSTSHMLASLFQAFGLVTGTYISPHLQRVTERIRVNGKPIDDATFVRHIQLLLPCIAHVDTHSPARVSYFEALTAMAFTVFSDIPVGIGILEVGMGGTWDATNVVTSEVSVITPISMDHAELGPTIADKAREKAGIISPNSVVVCAQQEPEALEIIRDRAKEQHAELYVSGEDFHLSGRQNGVGGQLVDIEGVAGQYNDLWLPLIGRHQAHNATLAVVAVEAMNNFERPLSSELVAQGLAGAQSPGRFERIYRDGQPLIILDGAHNQAGMETLAATLTDDISLTQRVIILGIVADKDQAAMVEVLRPVANHVIVTPVASDRQGDIDTLADLVHEAGISVEVADDAADAIDMAIGLCHDDANHAIIVTGSLYLVGEVRELLHTQID